MNNHMDNFIAFGGGSSLTFFTFLSIEELLTAIILGFLGGIGGLLAKWFLHYLVGVFKNDQ